MRRPRNLRRGIYLLPTLFTVGNLFCGFSSLVQSSRGAIEQGALLIIVAAVLDGLDGRIARLTGTTSDFGLQFDSLADIVSFGIAPALMAYHWALHPFGRIGWLVGFIFVVCAAMRLARFNLQASPIEKRHFAGLPSPAAASLVAAVAFSFPAQQGSGWVAVLLALLVASVALLMISRFRYRSLKEFDLSNRRSYIYVLPLAAVIVAIAVRPKVALLTIGVVYVLSGPGVYGWGLLRRLGTPGEPGVEGEMVDDPAIR